MILLLLVSLARAGELEACLNMTQNIVCPVEGYRKTWTFRPDYDRREEYCRCMIRANYGEGPKCFAMARVCELGDL